MDFSVAPTVAFRLLYGLVIIGYERRSIIHVNVTEQPSSQWVIWQLPETFPYDCASKYIVFDRDSIFGCDVRVAIKSFANKPARNSYRIPWQNGVVEHWMGSCRRELLDHIVVFNENCLRRLLRAHIASHYNRVRTHCSIEKDAREERPVMRKPKSMAPLVGRPRCGGLHHRYEWGAMQAESPLFGPL